MPDPSAIATAIREELVAAGIVRRPDTAGPLPPLIVEPRDAAPGPGDRDAPEDDATLIVTLKFSGDLAEGPLDTYRRRSVFDVRYRSKGTVGLKRARAVDAAIRTRLVGTSPNTLGFTMGTAHPVIVLSSGVFGGLSHIAGGPEGFDELAKYVFEVQA